MVQYFVRTTGNDSNNGLSGKTPFRTIQKAIDLAVPGDVINIHRGTYRESLKPKQSGTAIAPITLQNVGNEVVTVSGCDLLTGWKLITANLYEVSLSGKQILEAGENQLFRNGVPLTEARYPDTTNLSFPVFLEVTDFIIESTTAEKITATISNPAITNAIASKLSGAYINLCPRQRWHFVTGLVLSAQAGKVQIEFPNQDNLTGLVIGTPFFFWNKPGLLTKHGQWFITDDRLTYYNPFNPNKERMEIRQRAIGIDFSDISHWNIQGIRFHACRIHSNAQSKSINLDAIRVSYPVHFTKVDRIYEPLAIKRWEGGVVLHGESHSLTNSRIEYSANTLVTLIGEGHRVENCILRDANYVGSNLGALEADCWIHPDQKPRALTVTRNTVFNCAARAIGADAKASKFTHNRIYAYGIQCTDLGAFHSWAGSPGVDFEGTEIAYNNISDCRSIHAPEKEWWGGVGIYLDNGACGFRVHHNLVSFCMDGARLNLPSRNNKVFNNTFVVYSANGSGIATNPPLGDTTEIEGTEIRNNIFTKGYGGSGSVNGLPSAWVTSNNLIVASEESSVVFSPITFTLVPNSPAINAGVPIPPYTDGSTGNAPDLGCFEFKVSPWKAGSDLVV